MKKQILFCLLLPCILPIFAARGDDAPTNLTYCITADKLEEMSKIKSGLTPDMAQAYDMLFQILLKSQDSETTVGCVTSQDMATICNTIWPDNATECESFVTDITDAMTIPNEIPDKVLTLISTDIIDSLVLADFSDIDPDIFNLAVNKAVSRRRNKSIPSKLQDTGHTFYTIAQEKQINPFVMSAISLYESDRGTSSLARTRKNIAGLGGPGHWMSFDTVADSIQTQANTLKTNISKGRTTVTSLVCNKSYCATNAGPWGTNVRSIAKELINHYNAFVAKALQ